MNDTAHNPQSKINKCTYLLLKRYHRLYGLAVAGWHKQPGNRYFSFYSCAVRDSHGRPKHLPEVWGNYALTIYQDAVGIPAWASGEQLQFRKSSNHHLRSREILGWFEQHLDLSQFFSDYASEITCWREKYTVDRSERFLLTWNVMGLVSSRLSAPIYSSMRVGDADRATIEVWLRSAGSFSPPYEEYLYSCSSLVFCTDGRVRLPDSTTIDVWQEYLRGKSLSSIIEQVTRSDEMS